MKGHALATRTIEFLSHENNRKNFIDAPHTAAGSPSTPSNHKDITFGVAQMIRTRRESIL